MLDRNSSERALIDVDNKRLEFWQKPELLSSVPARLLLQTNWFAYHQNEIARVIAEKEQNGNISLNTLDSVIGSYKIVFKLPEGNPRAKKELDDKMFELRMIQRYIDEQQERIAQRKAEGKDTTHQERLLRRMMKPLPKSDADINSFLDSLRFEVSSLSLDEMKYQAPAKRIHVQEAREAMDND